MTVYEDTEGPFDIEDFDSPEQAALARLDLGSVLIPMPPGGQIQVEFNQTGVPTAIWVVTPNGRFTIATYAAPEVAGAVAGGGRRVGRGAAQRQCRGVHRGRPVGPRSGRRRRRRCPFIGVDGFRWMIRCVVNGMPHLMPALVQEAREALADTVVRRGETPAAGAHPAARRAS